MNLSYGSFSGYYDKYYNKIYLGNKVVRDNAGRFQVELINNEVCISKIEETGGQGIRLKCNPVYRILDDCTIIS